MNTKLLSCFTLSFFIFFLSSCNPKKAIEDKIAKEVAGAMLGTDVDISNVDESKESSVKVDLKNGSQSINFTTKRPTFQIMKDNKGEIIIAASIGKEAENKQEKGYSMLFGITGDASLMKGAKSIEFGEKEEGKLTASLITTTLGTEQEAKAGNMFGEPTMIETGTLKLVEFSEEKIIFEIDAKAKNLSMKEGENEENSFTGTITCENPAITFIGIKKEEVFN